MNLSMPTKHGFRLRRRFSRLRESFDRLVANPEATAVDLFRWAESRHLKLSIGVSEIKVEPREQK